MLAADRGTAWRSALGWIFLGQEAYIGVDYAEVSGQSARYLAANSLAGLAIGLRGAWRRLNYDVFLAKPIHMPDYFNAPKQVFGVNVSFELRD